MFGDYGHGSLILFIGACMVLFHDMYLKHVPALQDIQRLRYMFLLMGFFSCYNGLLYNEWFAIPYDWFGSCYQTYPLPNLNDGTWNFVPKNGYPATVILQN
jgi:V-type H+-transporting ATPase subunit a